MEALQVSYAILGCISTLVVGWLLHWVYKWMHPPCNGKLPPGSMGFPIVGETFQFFQPSPSLDIPNFYKERLNRYGPVFKTSLVGQPVVVSLDAELNRFIFQQEGKLFRSWYPDTSNSIFGKESINSYDGILHRYVRSLAARDFGLNNLKGAFLTEMADVVASSLQAWAAQPSIEVKEAISNMIFDMTAKKLIGFDVARARELRKNYESFFQGLIAFPLYVPGTTFYQCMQGRKKVQSVLKELLKKRLSAPDKRHGDLLDIVVDDLQSEKPVATEKFAIDAIAALLFASFATIASTLTVAMKFLTDNSKVVEALTEEHETILKKREGVDSSITWDEYKSMTFTAQVMNEITRVGNVAPGIFRKSLKDVQVNGYTIPAGWLVMISPMAVHLNPRLFEDPLTFNPWRWQDDNKSTLLRNFMPFGGGIRLCVGAEFSKVLIALFLHTLVTNYRWREVKGGDVLRISEIVFPQGYHIQLLPRT
ncbi:cytochrome P450 87A3-like [Miscanthus floridulus]|uniref:cytochrome P450 87A3-like n=1 Tax=Miscanthus floridulus TaxID=154761 RepID=UPI003457F442